VFNIRKKKFGCQKKILEKIESIKVYVSDLINILNNKFEIFTI
jgi:hypothetical protein